MESKVDFEAGSESDNNDFTETEDTGKEEEEEDLCAVCLNRFCEETQILAKYAHCSHLYHIGCIGRHILSRNTCPKCRHQIDRDMQPNLDQFTNQLRITGSAVMVHPPRDDRVVVRANTRPVQTFVPPLPLQLTTSLPSSTSLSSTGSEEETLLDLNEHEHEQSSAFSADSEIRVSLSRRRPNFRRAVNFNIMSDRELAVLSRRHDAAHYLDNQNNTILHVLCIRGLNRTLQTFIAVRPHEAQTALEVESACGNTPLHSALYGASPLNVVRTLYQHISARVLLMKNSEGRTPLTLAFYRGEVEAARCIFRKHDTLHVSTSSTDATGCNCLHHAVQHEEVTTTFLNRLIACGASVRQRELISGKTPWHTAQFQHHLECIERLHASVLHGYDIFGSHGQH